VTIHEWFMILAVAIIGILAWWNTRLVREMHLTCSATEDDAKRAWEAAEESRQAADRASTVASHAIVAEMRELAVELAEKCALATAEAGTSAAECQTMLAKYEPMLKDIYDNVRMLKPGQYNPDGTVVAFTPDAAHPGMKVIEGDMTRGGNRGRFVGKHPLVPDQGGA
jgi:hypothetical protein